MPEDVIALFEFGFGDKGIGLISEKHYKLVLPREVKQADLDSYRLWFSDMATWNSGYSCQGRKGDASSPPSHIRYDLYQ